MKKPNKFVLTLLSIVLGMLIGAIILTIAGINPWEAYKITFLGVFGKPKYVVWTIIRATPIILTGIGVAFAFRTGLFNIGVEGQYIMGTIATMLVGVYLDLPPIIHPIVAIAAGMLAGALWAGVVGILKSKFKVNEVISSIMLNWIAFYFNNYVMTFSSVKKPGSENSYYILDSASTVVAEGWKTSEAGKAFLSEHAVLKDILNPPLNFGIIIAILAAVAAWYILKYTTLGYQLRSVGFNKHAAEYGGINIKKNLVRAMMISGAFAGLGAATQVLGVAKNIGVLGVMDNFGFNGISVALIAGNLPIACIPAGLLFSALTYGGAKIQPVLHAPSEIINIVIGIIIFFIAMPKLFTMLKGLISKPSKQSSNDKEVGNASDEAIETAQEVEAETEVENETESGGEIDG